MKESLAEVRAVLREHKQVKHQFSDTMSKQYKLQNENVDDEITDCSQVLLVNLPQ